MERFFVSLVSLVYPHSFSFVFRVSLWRLRFLWFSHSNHSKIHHQFSSVEFSHVSSIFVPFSQFSHISQQKSCSCFSDFCMFFLILIFHRERVKERDKMNVKVGGGNKRRLSNFKFTFSKVFKQRKSLDFLILKYLKASYRVW